ncbi:MAG: ATP-dependent helicase HrpB [Maricaulaceae bacterium]
MTSPALPIDAALPQLSAALAANRNAVLVAPPGAGKTTRVPLALLNAPWLAGRSILMLEPRRLAARAAAARLAQTLGEAVGETAGYRVRMQTQVSQATRIEVLTEGVFTRRILNDPELADVGAVVFDEIHERSLEGDFGLALALESQAALRPDLRLLAMSATLDDARLAQALGQAPVITSEGRMFPVETRYLGYDARARLEDQVTNAVLKALAQDTGSLLVFLPGAGEIRRVAERLDDRITDPAVDIAPFYGALDTRAQDRAIQPSPPGRRKVVLATDIAQTSLTIEGVRGVIDAGLARRARYDPASGMTRLVTEKASRASADQRRGRAGRTEPGVCWRLWDEPQTRALIAFDPPEILSADLTGLALDLAVWGARAPDALAWIDPPPDASWRAAVTALEQLGALQADGGLSDRGRELARFPLHPRLAALMLEGAARGQAGLAGEIAALLSEPSLGGRSTDLRDRLASFRRDASPRGKAARDLARRWARLAGDEPKSARVKGAGAEPGALLAAAYPDRIAQAQGAGRFKLASGRGARVEPSDALAGEPFLAVGEAQGGAGDARITLAAPLSQAALEAEFADRITTTTTHALDMETGAVTARRVKRLFALELSAHPIPPEPEACAQALLDHVRAAGLSVLRWSEAAVRWRARVAFLHQFEGDPWPDLRDAALLARLEDWLAPALDGATRLDAVSRSKLSEGLKTVLPWELARDLDAQAPDRFATPAGTAAVIDYAAEAGPTIAVRVQEVFGLNRHPTVAKGRVPLVISLLSPARRPVQTTTDLPGFWAGSYREVAKDMRGRYPKHPWPEDPAAASPTTRAKPRR